MVWGWFTVGGMKNQPKRVKEDTHNGLKRCPKCSLHSNVRWVKQRIDGSTGTKWRVGCNHCCVRTKPWNSRRKAALNWNLTCGVYDAFEGYSFTTKSTSTQYEYLRITT